MKKYFKILVLIIILSTSRIKGVMAESFYEDNWISGVYANLVDGDFSKPQLMRFIRRKSDNQASYCITPRVLLYDDENYDVTSDLNLTEAQSKRIKRLAYFGYGYDNHTSNEWYAITQFMIWKVVEPNMDIFFTDKFKGNRISRFNDEIDELERLVDNPDIEPNIDVPNILLNNSYQLSDINNSLNDYKLTVPNGIEASIHDNYLYLKSSVPGNYTLQFNKEYNLYKNKPMYYSANKGQQILVPGNLDKINHQININVSKAAIYMTKQDTMTGEVLKDATYQLYDSNYNFVKELVTDENGQAKFEDLMPGIYYLLEINAPTSYLVDNTYHEFLVDDAIEYVWLNDDKIQAYVYLNKYISNNGIIQPEKNIKFEIYDLNDNCITNIITDSRGVAMTYLQYGKYRIHQVNTTDGYSKVNDFYVDIKDNEDKIYYLNDIKIEKVLNSENKTEESNKENNVESNKEDNSLIEESTKKGDFKTTDKIEEINIFSKQDSLIVEQDKDTIINPKTSDINIYIYVIVGYISFIILLYLIASIKEHNK